MKREKKRDKDRGREKKRRRMNVRFELIRLFLKKCKIELENWSLHLTHSGEKKRNYNAAVERFDGFFLFPPAPKEERGVCITERMNEYC